MKRTEQNRTEKRRLKNRRLIYITAIAAVLISSAVFAGYKILNSKSEGINADVKKTHVEPKVEAKVEPPIEKVNSKPAETHTEIIISSTGDSTLGTDEKFGYSQSLPQVLAKNNNDLSYFYSNVSSIFMTDDITTTNLETTFTDAVQKAEKQFTFKGSPEYANALNLGGIEAVNLSNNHIYDYLQKGFNDTITALNKANISYFGEGNILVKEVKGIKVGFLGYKGYSYDKAFLSKLKKDIQDLKAKTNFVIINFHWGEENKYEPNNIQKYLAHYSIDEGADLIIGHHPHVIQGMEKYKGKIIAYSMGNFAFGGNRNPSDKDTFILQTKLKFINNKAAGYEVKVIPASISSVSNVNDYRPTPMTGDKKEALLAKLNKLSFNLGFKVSDEFQPVVDENEINK